MKSVRRPAPLLFRRPRGRLALLTVLATIVLSTGLAIVSQPAMAAGSCAGYPFGWTNIQNVVLNESGNAQVQIFQNPDRNGQLIVRLAKGPGFSGSLLNVHGFEVGTDATHNAYGAISRPSDVPAYPLGWCSNASLPNRVRVAITYSPITDSLYNIWYQMICIQNIGCTQTGYRLWQPSPPRW
jgi:hypothetical protein